MLHIPILTWRGLAASCVAFSPGPGSWPQAGGAPRSALSRSSPRRPALDLSPAPATQHRACVPWHRCQGTKSRKRERTGPTERPASGPGPLAGGGRLLPAAPSASSFPSPALDVWTSRHAKAARRRPLRSHCGQRQRGVVVGGIHGGFHGSCSDAGRFASPVPFAYTVSHAGCTQPGPVGQCAGQL